MAGNSQRRGATRNVGSKKGAKVGTGGHGRKSLEGRGPTPKAEERPYHAAYKRKKAAERREEEPRRGASGRGGDESYRGRDGGSGRGRDGAPVRGGTANRPGVRRGQSRSGGKRGGGNALEVVAGRNSVLEALRAEIPVQTVYIASRFESDDRTREILATASARKLPMLEVTRPELDRLTDDAIHQGVALQVPPYEYCHPDDLLKLAEDAGEAPFIVALDGVTDPRNLGAVLRSAGAFGVHGVAVPERRSVGMTASAWKVSAGAAARVPVAKASNLNRMLEAYRGAGLFVVGLDAGGSMEISEVDLATGPLVVVVGSEGKGLSRLVRENCDIVASVPMAASTESLNASVAAGIAFYEVAKARRS